jgi:hypothetical protein
VMKGGHGHLHKQALVLVVYQSATWYTSEYL